MNSPSIKTRTGVVPVTDNSCSGAAAINAMRQMLGRSSLASAYEKLTPQQRAIVLYGARIKPSDAINKPLMSMSEEHREAIRQSVIALADMARVFAGMNMGREQIISRGRKPQAATQTAATATPLAVPQQELDSVTRMAAQLAGEMKALQ
ncbi:hypothetical protein [Shewanella algae]|uniref:hypothetical protein n=1 Tax=Shewanella algae TaxID=38313 RepID=UPI001C584D1C|nr:hypothetical protein [Shewanella algae]